MVDTVDGVNAAMEHIGKCAHVTVGCGGFAYTKTYQIAVIQVCLAQTKICTLHLPTSMNSLVVVNPFRDVLAQQ